MAAYKMAAVKVTQPNDFPLGLIRSHMVVIHLFLMFCDLQRVVRDLCLTLYITIHTLRHSTYWASTTALTYRLYVQSPLRLTS